MTQTSLKTKRVMALFILYHGKTKSLSMKGSPNRFLIVILDLILNYKGIKTHYCHYTWLKEHSTSFTHDVQFTCCKE